MRFKWSYKGIWEDEELVMRHEWQKERDRRERVRESRLREQSEKQEAGLAARKPLESLWKGV